MIMIYGRQIKLKDEKGLGNLFHTVRSDFDISDFRRSHHGVNVRARSPVWTNYSGLPS